MGTHKKRTTKKNKKTQEDNDEPEHLGTINPPPEEHLADQHRIEDEQMVDDPNAEKGLNDDELPEGEVQLSEEVQPKRKRKRGPTRMKKIAKNPNDRIRVDYNHMGVPIGEGSTKMASYVGVLVREHVPFIISRWPKVPEDLKTLLWRSVQARFDLHEEYQKAAALHQMNRIWRSSKSILVKAIREAKNHQDRMKLRPRNVDPVDWCKFVKLKTSAAFKVVSDSYKERKKKQIPHTTSRKGIARLTEELKENSSDPSEVTRLDVWMKSRTKKDGTPVNTNAAEKFKKAAELKKSGSPSSTAYGPGDALTQLLGPDNPGRMRAMGPNMNKTKLACFQMNHKIFTEMQENQIHLQQTVHELRDQISQIRNQRQEYETGENSAPRSVNKGSEPKCVLIDWAGDYANVAEGRIISSDPKDMVNNSPLGPYDLKVLVETATVPEASLWRPAHQIFTIEDAVGHMIAWPAKKCVNLEQELQQDDIATLGTRTDSLNKCKLLDLSNDDVVVAEGRWLSKDPKALVNGLPIGPKAVKVFVDEVHQSETFIWRATMEVSYLEDCLLSFVAWPYCKVVFENTVTNGACQKDSVHKSASVDQSGGKSASAVLKATGTGEKSHIDTTTATCQKSAATKSCQKSAATSKEKSTAAAPKSGEKSTKGSKSPATDEIELASQSPLRRSPRKNIGRGVKENQKCKLMDITGKKRVVAEGRVYKTDPAHMVHNVPVGPNAVSVWIDKAKVDDAALWKPSDEFAFVKDSLGLPVAWPIDKLVFY